MRDLAAFVLALACGIGAAVPAAQDQSPADWVKARAIPLKTVVAGNGFDDMRPLARVIGDARIVSLGEATHGSREFFQLKHRMLEFLATEMGFTIFSIEANMPESYRLNDYVLNGTGDPAVLLKGLYFWTWDTEEVLGMIRWMHEFNAAGRGRVQFTGFDMQTPAVAAGIVGDFVATSDPGLVDAVRLATRAVNAGSAPAASARAAGPAPPPPASVVTWWKEVVAGLEGGQVKYRASGASDAEIAWAIQNARVALQCAQMRANEVSRDRSMAENVKWILDQDPKARIVLWAHNAHVAADGFGFETMGADPENQPYANTRNLRATEAYDVMLFVDKTTAAVANPPCK